MFDFLKKRDLYDQGFEDAETMYSVWKDITSPLEAYKVVQNHILQTEEFETKPLREIEGWKGFLVQLASKWQIPAETSTNLACDLLEFLNEDGVTTPPSPTAVCTQPSNGYAVAETVYYNLIGRGLDIEEIYAHFEQNKLSLTQGLSVNDRAGFFSFRDKVIKPRFELEQTFKLS
jgi:hypothetical protein